MKPQQGIRAVTLVLVGVAVLAVSWFLLTALQNRGSGLPSPGWVAGLAMVALAGGLLVVGRQVRQVRDGKAPNSMSPLRAARTLVLGQAAALTGSALVGWYLASVLVILPDADVSSQRDRLWPFLAHAVIAAGLAVVGMVVQRWCRLRPRGDHDEERDPERSER